MGLSAFKPTTQVVKFPDDEFAVRGLALEDLTILLRDYYEPISALFDQYVTNAAMEKVDNDTTGGLLNLGDMKSVVLEALQTAPGLVGDAIARGADETENPHIARLLPIGVQIEAITKIVTLTLDAEGGLEKLLETVINLTASLSTMAANRSQ